MEGKELCKHWGCPFFEASALSRKNVDESFYQVVREIKMDREPKGKGKNSSSKKQKLKKKFDGLGCKVI